MSTTTLIAPILFAISQETRQVDKRTQVKEFTDHIHTPGFFDSKDLIASTRQLGIQLIHLLVPWLIAIPVLFQSESRFLFE